MQALFSLRKALTIALIAGLWPSCQSWGKFWSVPSTTCAPPANSVSWAKSQSGGNDVNRFFSVATDCEGNIYAAGFVQSTVTYNFGNGVTLTGNTAGAWKTAILLKYDAAGNALWGRRITSSTTTESDYRSIAVDNSGNVYAVGTIYDSSTFSFGNGVTLTTSLAANNHVVIAKYDSNGTALWARTSNTFTGTAFYDAVAVDSSGNAYAGARINYAGTLEVGNGVTVTSGVSTTANWAVIKYNESGLAQWANIAVAPAGADYSYPLGITADNLGSVFACGIISNNGVFNFSGATAQGNFTGQNAAIAKFSAATGSAIIARSTTAPSSAASNFNRCATDKSGQVYATGSQNLNGAYGWGGGITSTGSATTAKNAVIVKYDNNLTPLWALSTSTGPGSAISQFNAVAADSAGNAWAAGFQEGNAAINYGNGVSATGGFSGAGGNSLIVKYSAAGVPQLAKIVNPAGAFSFFDGVAVVGDLPVAVGLITNTGNFTFDTGLTTAGSHTTANVAIVKYP